MSLISFTVIYSQILLLTPHDVHVEYVANQKVNQKIQLKILALLYIRGTLCNTMWTKVLNQYIVNSSLK